MLQTLIRVVRSVSSHTCTTIAPGRSLQSHSPIVRHMATQSSVPITSPPAAGQIVTHEGKEYETLREGQAFILVPPNTQKHVDPQNKARDEERPQNVFYNPIQQFNRDLSVLSIKAFGEDWLQRRRIQRERSAKKPKKQRKQAELNPKKRKSTEVEDEAVGEDTAAKRRKSADGIAVEGQSGVAAGAPEESADQGEAGVKVPKEQDGGEVTIGAREANGEAADGPATSTTTNGHPPRPSGPQFRILDALSATGLRALRYAKEIPFVTGVVANDMNPNAIKSMNLNIEHNRLTSQINPSLGDAIGLMYRAAYPPPDSHGPKHVYQRYEVIDLDPYGTAAPFIDASLQAISDGGLLCVTCTDSGVFASTGYCEKTYSLYGGMPIKGSHMHEGGLRLIINSVATSAAKYGLAIEPLLSLSIDFYARVFIRVRKSPADVKFLAGKTMLVYGCDSGCGAWTTNMLGRNTKQKGKKDNDWFKHSIAQAPSADRLCNHCGSKTHVAGPMWGGPIHNAAFIEKILEDLESVDPTVYETKPRIEGMLTTALDELSINDRVTQYVPSTDRTEGAADIIPKVPPETIDHFPFFFNSSTLSKVIHCVAPPDAAMRGALRHMGYRATRSHCQPGSIKTDAPWTALWEVMREWVRQKQPIKEGALKETTAGFRIMQAAKKVEETTNGAEESGTTSKDGTPDIITDENRPSVKTHGGAERPVVVFDEVLGKEKPSKKIVRYQQNPRENWGPMTKAKGSG